MEGLPLSVRRPLVVVAAVGDDLVAGIDNHLPWCAPEDLRRFKELTYGHPVIMGRRTWEGLGSPLSGRQNIVLSIDPDFATTGATRAGSLAEALARSHGSGPIFVIGGHVPWAEALQTADEIRLTRIYGKYRGDVWFPHVDEHAWKEIDRDICFSSVDGTERQIDFITLRRY